MADANGHTVLRKPPLGLKPQWLWVENRVDAIEDVVGRYWTAGARPPLDWAAEWAGHVRWLVAHAPPSDPRGRRNEIAVAWLRTNAPRSAQPETP